MCSPSWHLRLRSLHGDSAQILTLQFFDQRIRYGHFLVILCCSLSRVSHESECEDLPPWALRRDETDRSINFYLHELRALSILAVDL